MTNAPSKPYIWRFAFDDNFSEAAANSTNKGYSFEKRKVSTFVEYSAFERLQAENAELQAKYNFMVDSAQQNARERDELHEELRQREMATPTMNAVQMLTRENQKLCEELEQARGEIAQFMQGPQWRNDEVQKIINEKAQLKAELDQAMAENGKLRVVLLDMFKMIDEGMLVRDITKDGDECWAFEMLKFVSRLNRARAALAEEKK